MYRGIWHVWGLRLTPRPLLQKNMDPEIMEEFKERHAKMAGAQSALQSGDLMGGCVGYS